MPATLYDHEEDKFNKFLELHEARIRNASLPVGENACQALRRWTQRDYDILIKAAHDDLSIEDICRLLQRSKGSIESRLSKLHLINFFDCNNNFIGAHWSKTIYFNSIEYTQRIEKHKMRNSFIEAGFIILNKNTFVNKNGGKRVKIGKFITPSERKESKKS